MGAVIPLDTPERLPATAVGAKAARLAELMGLGLPVPPGCVLSVAAFRKFSTVNGIDVGKMPVERCIRLIKDGSFPSELLDELTECLGALPAGSYAVRSSAVAEDGKSLSMAGQFDTYLNVPRQDILKRVKDCWIGMFGSAVTAYASRNSMPRVQEMGVIVQHQIAPRYAGVLFTLDPVTGSADRLVIEWVDGLGERLVSGAVTPERLYLDRRQPAVPDQLPPDLAHDLSQLAEYAVRAERHFGFPTDIEWCSDASGVFLLQARPITAVGERDAVVWTNTNMSENFPKPLTPFAWSVVERFYTLYVLNLARMLGIRDPRLHRRQSPVNRLTGVQCGRIYYNIKSWYELLHTYLPAFAKTFRTFLDQYIGQTVPVDLDPACASAQRRRYATGPLRHLSFWSRLAFYLSGGSFFLNRFERIFLDFRRQLRQPPYSTLTAAALVGRLDDLFEDFVAAHWYHQCIADFSVLVFPGILENLVTRWVPTHLGDSGQIWIRLMQQHDLTSAESARIIARMAQAIGERPPLAQLLDDGDYDALEAALPPPLSALFNDFLQRFGSRCYHECMIVSPTFEERHDLFWDLVGRCRLGEGLRAGNGRAAGNGDTDDVDEILRSLPLGKRRLVAWAARRARHALALREQGRLVQSMLFGEVRKLALSLGERLAHQGHLAVAEDVFYLHLSEVRDVCHGQFLMPETLSRLVAMRREALRRCDESEPPECFVLGQGLYWKEHTSPVAATDAAVLRGTPASRGRATGKARVIFDPISDNRLQPGDILVARSTDPGWTPLFVIAGALVLERGGMLSHGAIVARELGIPVVVGVAGATRRIPDGMHVRVDGDAGVVDLLDTLHSDRDEEPELRFQRRQEHGDHDAEYRESA